MNENDTQEKKKLEMIEKEIDSFEITVLYV